MKIALWFLAFAIASPALASVDEARIRIGTERPAARVSDRFLSFALDIAQVVGGKWWNDSHGASGGRGTERVPPFDFSPERLRNLTRALSPAYLRVGGSEADFTYYELAEKPGAPLPRGDESALTRREFDALADFSDATSSTLFFDLNAGPGARESGHGPWNPENALELVRYARDRHHAVPVWELGNEVNAFWLLHGLGGIVSSAQYARDYELARSAIRDIDPAARIAGPASAYWPLLGEPFSFLFGILRGFLDHVRSPVDVITWHFYPTESDRCPLAVRPASLSQMLSPKSLNESRRWAWDVLKLRDRYQPEAEIWISETGPAQCGGERGLSDRFASSFWWLDELGTQARFGTQVVARQTLTGSDYGMIRESDLTPNPDYWGSLLWKRLMGTRALDVQGIPNTGTLRAYAHCTPGARDGSVSVLLLNVSQKKAQEIAIEGFGNRNWQAFTVTADSPLEREIRINGSVPQILKDGTPAEILPKEHVAGEPTALRLPPLSYAFLRIDAAGAAACLE